MQQLALVSLVVDDYDEAIAFFVDGLGFELAEDRDEGPKRWVEVRPPGSTGCGLVLAKASDTDQRVRVGDQTGGRVFLFLQTDDFERDYRRMTDYGVEFLEEPRHEPYGTVAVFHDLYGNKWDLLEPTKD
jgi:catechol 2,3-dioxygenase-like lactoylglutathione lyase family enzyme